jgi:iron complex outermembrane receptor protein
MARGGFRLDHEPQSADQFTLQGDYYAGWQNQTFNLPSLTPPFTSTLTPAIDLSGGNLLGRWTRTFSDESNLRVQAYYDRTSRDVGFHAEDRDTVDLDAQHRFPLASFNDIVWGVGYRATSDRIRKESFALSFNPDRRTDHLVSAFVQDEIRLVPERLSLTLGSKFEHNDYSGFEAQPNARLMWTPHERHSAWASVARAVRTPSRAHSDLRLNTAVIPGMLNTVLGIFGNDRFGSEDLVAYEMGYRVRPVDRLSLDATAFYNDYRNLNSTVPGTPFVEAAPAPPHLVLPLPFANNLRGEVYGAEAAATARLADRWQVRAGYTYTQMQLHQQGGAGASEAAEGASPHHRFFIHSMLNLPHDVQFDGVLRYVDSLPALKISSYVEMDLRLSWKPWKNTEFSIVGQNLLHSRRSEYTSQSVPTPLTDVQRSVYAQVTFRF